jgi:DNA-binding transcriptional regulator PaaX
MAALTSGEILDTLTYFGYTETYRHFRGLPSKIPKRKPILENALEKLQERQKISKLIYKLKNDGLIVKNRDKKIWGITNEGKNKIKKLTQEVLGIQLKSGYKVEQSDELKIVIFDIPESMKEKRRWLRDVLRNLKFTMLQKSVWIGKTILPENFIKDSREQNILKYIEIIVVTKYGTLKHAPII